VQLLDIRLEPEQIDILGEIVQAHRSVPREQRDEFLVIHTSTGTVVLHSGLRDWSLQVARSDLEVLVDVGLLRPRYGDRGLLAGLVVLPNALDFYDALQRSAGDPFDTPPYNSPFSDAEVGSIEEAIERVRKVVSDAGMPPDAMAEVDRKLDYILGAAHRLGRFDWKMVAFTMIWDVAVQATFNPERARALVDLVLRAGGQGVLGTG
jgi:hypothetical protein